MGVLEMKNSFSLTRLGNLEKGICLTSSCRNIREREEWGGGGECVLKICPCEKNRFANICEHSTTNDIRVSVQMVCNHIDISEIES